MGAEERQHADLTADEIRGRYFGKQASRGPGHPTVTTPFPHSQDMLTPTAKYVIREAKSRLGQQNALGQGNLPDEEDLFRLVRHVEDLEGEELSEKERTSVVAALSASLDHYDILTPLIENRNVNDIIVRSYRDISIQSGRRNIQTDLQFPDHDTYKSFIENLLKRAGKACTSATPVVDAAIDPHVRACVTHESFSPSGTGPMLTLRISRHRGISLDGLVQNELAPRIVLEYLAALVHHGDVTILVAGEVGTGKTTLIKALTTYIPEHEAILVIEDTHEIVLDRPFVRTLLTREANTEGTGRISPAQAIRTGMRMAMNRIILGEMRDAEAAEAFIDVCASGHSGMSTVHSRNAKDALSRMELFLARAQGKVGIETIRKQLANAISIVVFLGVDKHSQKRRIIEVIEVGSSGDGAIQVSPIFSFINPTASTNPSIPEWKRNQGITLHRETLLQSGIKLPQVGEILSFDPENLYRNLHRPETASCKGSQRAGIYGGMV